MTAKPARDWERLHTVAREFFRGLVAVTSRQPFGRGAFPDDFLDECLHRFVDCVLDGSEHPGERPSFSEWKGLKLPDCLTGLDPQEVAVLYEDLRRFEPDRWDSTGGEYLLRVEPRLRRNQGLFYTPRHVVEYIVRRSLDALEIEDTDGYRELTVLDPAAGAGVFLIEVLEQLTRRIVDASEESTAAVKRHIVANALFGVDQDTVAVKIARAALTRRVGDAADMRNSVRMIVGDSLIGSAGTSTYTSSAQEDAKHWETYYGGRPKSHTQVQAWARQRGVLHWAYTFPEVFGNGRSGFGLIVGNPPYEIVSEKESGIAERKRLGHYLRKTFETCDGKLNTYRLMIERGISLLAPGGVLGFLVPATLLADSTARKLRRLVMDSCEIVEAVVIPEKARVFSGVTQALLVLICRKGQPTVRFTPRTWDPSRHNEPLEGIELDRSLVDKLDFRVPILRRKEERELVEAISRFPPLGGGGENPPVALVHQGEINMTVHREYLRTEPTRYPLVRGEHIRRFHVGHPSDRPGRFDWVADDYAESLMMRTASGLNRTETKSTAWRSPRIALARVVNMAVKQRLKAARIPAGTFLGDMTNFLWATTVPESFLLGLLNSRLLNWRMRLTSSNNYVSAAEIVGMPVPRIPTGPVNEADSVGTRVGAALLHCLPTGIPEAWEVIDDLSVFTDERSGDWAVGNAIAELTEILTGPHCPRDPSAVDALIHGVDALVLDLYGVRGYANVMEE